MRNHFALLVLAFGILLPGLSARALSQTPATSVPNVWTWVWAGNSANRPETLFFRHHFRLTRLPLSAQLQITADDSYLAYLNGHTPAVATGNDWTTVQEFDVTRSLQKGENLLAVEVTNTGGPGGLLYRLTMRYPGNKTLVVVSGPRTRYNPRVPPVWTKLSYDDSKWAFAKTVAPVNGAPWGKLRGAPVPDPSRIVRLWNIRGGNPAEDPYNRPRSIGERMLLSTSADSRTDMQLLAGAGFSLFQTDSNHLSTEESATGKWDFHTQETSRRTVNELTLDWSYFPHYAFPPEWYRRKVPFTRLQCLEHEQPVQAFSLWEPLWHKTIEEGYSALKREFGKTEQRKQPTVSALYVGVHGDYGDAGTMTGGRVSDDIPAQKEAWQREFGDTHDHIGWWCADPLARADFREKMLAKYGTLANLNKLWKRNYSKPEEIAYPASPAVASRREWLDFVGWYQAGVAHGVESNLSVARKEFPDTLLMLPVGFSDEDLRAGFDVSSLVKLCARYKASLRSTHAAIKPFADNAATTFGRLGSASRFYDVPFWAEGPDGLNANQEVERIFEAVSQGATGYFDWTGSASANRDVYYRYGKYLRVEKPVTDVAMFYPAQAQKLRPEQGYAPLFAQACAFLRDATNFDIVDDQMVLDGCLSRYRVLVLWEGTLADQDTLDSIRKWVRDGGVLVAYDFGKVTTFENNTEWFADLFGYVQQIAPARMTERYAGTVPAQYRLLPGQPEAADFLGDGWFPPRNENGLPLRWTGATATVRLPVNPEKSYVLVVRAVLPEEAGNKVRRVLINGREVGRIEALGDVTYRFPIAQDALSGSNLVTLTFQSETYLPPISSTGYTDRRPRGVRIRSIALVEEGVKENQEAPMPSGRLRREFDLRRLNDDWTRRYGKGLTIYYPATRQLLRGYIELLRRVIYHLGDIDAGRRSALPVDEEVDGVYATLFTDKILLYNPQDKAVTKTVSIPAEMWAAWKGEVATPTESTWKVALEPHSIGAIYLSPPPQELLFECERFLDLGGIKPTASPDCSPGSGVTSVRLGKGNAITTRFPVDIPGKYAVYVRAVRNGKPEPVDVWVDNQPLPPLDTPSGQTILSGAIPLTRGTHSLTLRSRTGRDVRADYVLLTNDPNISGYGFAGRSAPVE